MRQEFIGFTPIKSCNDTVNKFKVTYAIDYFEDESALQKAINFIKELGYDFDFDDSQAYISGEALLIPISVIADTNQEAKFLAVKFFSKWKLNSHI